MPFFSSFVRCFDEVARYGSIRRAAERLHIAPSAVNRHILNFEHELGTRLFERLPRGMRLTEAGQILIKSARRCQDEVREAQARIEELKGLQRGHVALVAVEGVVSEFVPSVLTGFNATYAQITTSIRVLGSETALQVLLAGDADLGILFNAPRKPALKIVKEVPFKLGLVVPAKHPLAKKKRLWLRDCASYPAIIAEETLSLRAVLDAALAASKVNLKVVFESNSISVMKSLVMRGAGITFLTRADIAQEVARGELKYVPIQDVGQSSVLCMCVSAERTLSPGTKALLQYFAEALSDL